jgi:PAS domain S-box-containing protein
MPTLHELETQGSLLLKGIESITDYAIFTLSPEGNIVTWNQGAEHITGYQAREIIGQSIVRFYKPEVVLQGHVENILALARGSY